MHDPAYYLEAVREATAADLRDLAEREAERACAAADTIVEVQEHVAGVRNRCLDTLLSEPFVAKVAEAVKADPPDRRLLAHDLRRCVAPLRFEPPLVLENRAMGLAVAGAVGAVLGMLGGTALSLWLTGERTLGFVVGAPVGAAFVVSLVAAIARSKPLRVVVQSALGAGAAALIAGSLSPGHLWRHILGARGGRGVWGTIKAVLLFFAAIVALQLAAPRKRMLQESYRRALRKRLDDWLANATDLLAFFVVLRESASSEPPAPQPLSESVLRAVQKLAQATSDAQRLNAAAEIEQEFRSAGTAFEDQEPLPPVFQPSLERRYRVLGLIKPGDAYRLLEPPVLKNGRVMVRGLIARKRT